MNLIKQLFTLTLFLIPFNVSSHAEVPAIVILLLDDKQNETEEIDITDTLFTNRSANCADYAGSYFSNVTDIQRALDFTGDVETSSDAATCTFVVNMIPNHDFHDASGEFATDVSEQNETLTITATPGFAATATEIELNQAQILFLNGVILDTLPAACYGAGSEPLGKEKIGCGQNMIDHPWRYDPVSSLNDFGTDAHNAHVQPDGTYHYHANPVAMFEQDCSSASSASPVIGFAADGFPVYGFCIEDGAGGYREVTSSYVLKDEGGPRQAVPGYLTPAAGTGTIASSNYDGQFRGDWEYNVGSGDLDECNGMTVDGQYGYYITNSFPWSVNCFKGTPDSSF